MTVGVFDGRTDDEPEVISVEDNQRGSASSLANLARLVERRQERKRMDG